MSNRATEMDDLIREAYAVVAQPEKLFDLHLRLERAQQRSDHAMGVISEHIDQVGELFDAIHLGPEADFSKMGLLPPDIAADAQCGAFLTMTPDLVVRQCSNPDWLDAEIGTGDLLPGWLYGFQKDTSRRLKRAARDGVQTTAQYFRFYAGPEDDRGFMSMVRVSSEDANPMIECSRVSLDWNEGHGVRFAEVMGLSDTELALTSFIVSGRSVSDFAEHRGRSVGTARNQMKAIQRKLGIGSQSELVSLYAGFSSSVELDKIVARDDQRPAFGNEVVLPGGSKQKFQRYGKAGGRPVLLLHGAIEGPFLPHSVQHAAQIAGLELLVPWMPYFSDTDRTRDPRERIERFVQRIDLFCDALHVERCGLLAMSVSCAYGLAALKRLPHRFVGLVAFALPIPLDEVQNMDGLNPFWRAPLVIGRNAPGVVEMLIRSVVRLAMRGEASHYFERLLKDSPTDLQTMLRPDVAAVVRKAFLNRPDKAQRAMAHALLVQCLDWSDWLSDQQNPITLVIGEHDSIHSPDEQLEFCARHGIAAVGPLEGVGAFTMFQDPHVIFSEVNALFDA